MRIAVINPNTTASMTRRIVAAAVAAAGPGTEIVGMQPMVGPEAIEGPFDGALSVPGLLKQVVAAEADSVEAHIIACFDDTGSTRQGRSPPSQSSASVKLRSMPSASSLTASVS